MSYMSMKEISRNDINLSECVLKWLNRPGGGQGEGRTSFKEISATEHNLQLFPALLQKFS